MAATLFRIDSLLQNLEASLSSCGWTDSSKNHNSKQNMKSIKSCQQILTAEALNFYRASTALYRFDTFNENAQKYLQENGFIAIKNVLNNQEIAHFKSLLWQFLEKCTKMKRDDVNTWDDENFSDICHNISKGISNDLGIGQSSFQWFIRCHPKILDIFIKIWNVDSYKDLLCSMGGVCIFRPFNYNFDTYGKFIYSHWKTERYNDWFHIDQNPIMKPKFACLQAYVTMYDQNECTGGTVVVPKSHLKYTDIVKKHGKDCLIDIPIIKDFVTIDESCDYIKNDDKMLICLEKGDLFIWDSRLVHCSTHAVSSQLISNQSVNDNKLNTSSSDHDINGNDEKTDEITNNCNATVCDHDKSEMTAIDFLRLVSFVTYAPKSKVDPNNAARFYENRVKAFEEQMSLTHWPYEIHISREPLKDVDLLHREKIGLIKNELSQLTKKENEIQASLIGFDECCDIHGL